MKNLYDNPKQCFGKIKYRTLEKAEFVATKRSVRYKIKLRVYICNLCHMFHLTKSQPTKSEPWQIPMQKPLNPDRYEVVHQELNGGSRPNSWIDQPLSYFIAKIQEIYPEATVADIYVESIDDYGKLAFEYRKMKTSEQFNKEIQEYNVKYEKWKNWYFNHSPEKS